MRLDMSRLLPHEVVFGAFLLVMWARLVFAVGWRATDTVMFGALIFVNVIVVAAAEQNPTRARWIVRLLFYPIAMNVVFQQLRTAIPAVHPAKADAMLRSLDDWLVGGNLSLALQPYTHPIATEVLSFCYLLFFPYVLFSLVSYFMGDLERLKKFCVGLFSLYGLGFLGYSLVPAAGPYLASADEFTVPLVAYKIAQWNAELVRAGSNGVDVFPSLHCAVSAFFLAFDRVHRPRWFKLCLAPAVGLWISTIYLRYHYFVDVLAGFALAAVAMLIVRRYEHSLAKGKRDVSGA